MVPNALDLLISKCKMSKQTDLELELLQKAYYDCYMAGKKQVLSEYEIRTVKCKYIYEGYTKKISHFNSSINDKTDIK